MTSKLLFVSLFVSLSACSSSGKESETAASTEKGKRERTHLDPKKLSYAMRGNEDEYRKCFMQSIGSRGWVTLAFDINQRGEVESASVEDSSLGQKSVGACLTERLGEQLFGEQPEPTKGRWTFVFNLTDPIDEEERRTLLKEADRRNENSFQLLPESEGSIDAGHLDEIVQVNYPLYAHCYRDSIRRRGESRGMLRLRLLINEEGRLVHVDDAGSVLPDPYAVDCMVEAFFAMDFPKPAGGPALIKYGLDFE